jgi:hypothetical protein
MKMKKSVCMRLPLYSVFPLLQALLTVLLAIPPDTVFAAQSSPPAPGLIRVDNRLAGTADTVTVTGLSAGDTVRVYADEAGASLLGSAVVPGGSSGASVVVEQLGVDAGHLYVTVTNPANSESRRIVKSYSAEPVSYAPSASAIAVDNAPLGTSDKVTVRGLRAGDAVKVYRDRLASGAIGTATVSGSGSAEVYIDQLGSGSGVIYVTVTEAGKRESAKIQKAYYGEKQTAPPSLGSISVDNKLAGSDDTVSVSGLTPGDIVNIYADENIAAPLASAAVAPGASSATVATPQLGSDGGLVYVTVTSPPNPESKRIAKLFAGETGSPPPAPALIAVRNNPPGMNDEVEVFGLNAGDVIKIYGDETTASVLASAAVGSGEHAAVARTPQLSGIGGYLYVSVTKTGKRESARTKKALPEEGSSVAPDRSMIRVDNHVTGISDKITVSGLSAGDVIRVYADDVSVLPIVSASVPAGSTAAQAVIDQLGVSYGLVYVTVTTPGRKESRRIPKIYAAEPVTRSIFGQEIRVVNAAGSASDEVIVTGLQPGDVVRLYASEAASTAMKNTLGQEASATAAADQTGVVIGSLKLDPFGGKVFVTVQATGKLESNRVMKAYPAE